MFPAMTMLFASSLAALSGNGFFLRSELRRQGRVTTSRPVAAAYSAPDVGQKYQRQGEHHQNANHGYRFMSPTRQPTLGRLLLGMPTDISLR